VNDDVVFERFGRLAFRRRRLAGLLLDQGFFAGLGNYLRSEILFAARTNPLARPVDCDEAGARRISRSIVRLMRRSYRTGGITNSPSCVKRLRSRGWSRPEYRFAVFGRDGQACHVCGEIILRQELAGRRLYYCPGCQQGPGV
jgi:endonuclease-8